MFMCDEHYITRREKKNNLRQIMVITYKICKYIKMITLYIHICRIIKFSYLRLLRKLLILDPPTAYIYV